MPRNKHGHSQRKARGKNQIQQNLLDDLADFFSDSLEDEFDEEEYYNDEVYSPPSSSLSGTFASSPQEPISARPSALSTEAFEALFEDEYHRYKMPFDIIGHALIDLDQEHPEAMQFAPPPFDGSQYPHYTELNHISLFQHDEKLMARASADDGTSMLARRSIHIKIKDHETKQKKHFQLLLFTPEHNGEGKPYPLGNLKKAPLFTDESTPDIEAQKRELMALPRKEKSGKVVVDRASITKREASKRKPSQTKVMKKSAMLAYSEFYQTYESILSEEMKNLLLDAIDARLNGNRLQQQPEWLHAISYRLTPLSKNPQTKTNLAAGNHHANTDMNITERVVGWHAKTCHHEKQVLKAKFTTLPGTDILDEGYIKGKIKSDRYTVSIKQKVSPWIISPNYANIADVVHTALVTQSILDDMAPKRQKVIIAH